MAFLECRVADPASAGNLAENPQTPTISERDFFKNIEFQENRFNTFLNNYNNSRDLNFQLRATTVGSQQNAPSHGAKLAFLIPWFGKEIRISLPNQGIKKANFASWLGAFC